MSMSCITPSGLINIIHHKDRRMDEKLNYPFATKKTVHLETLDCHVFINKCVGDDTKATARQSLNCIKNRKNKIWRKRIFNMAD